MRREFRARRARQRRAEMACRWRRPLALKGTLLLAEEGLNRERLCGLRDCLRGFLDQLRPLIPPGPI